MKAVQIRDYGGPEALHIVDDAPKPILKSGQVLIETAAATINPFDYKLQSGAYKAMIPLTFPMVVGGDFSGKIIALGEGVTGFAVGDEVFGSAIVLNGGSGAFAEYTVANLGNVAKRPIAISLQEAASLPLVGSSAVQAIEEHIGLQSSQKILIHGGAGGIGSIAIQIAKSKGAYVATTISSDDMDFVKSLGADEVIDYKTQKFEEILHDYDAVYDTVGGQTTNVSFKVLKKGGMLVSMLGEPDKTLAEKYSVRVIGQNTQTNTKHLSRVAQLVDDGVIKPEIERVFSFQQVKDAFIFQEKIHPRGKVVVKIIE